MITQLIFKDAIGLTVGVLDSQGGCGYGLMDKSKCVSLLCSIAILVSFAD